MQLAAPWVVLHTVAQVLQCSGSAFKSVSQPFDARPSQFPYPALHVMLHALPLHDAVPWVVLQAAPQPPQFNAEEVVFVSQPFTTLLSQLPHGAAQLIPQAPPLQLGVPFAVLHVVVHVPQCVASLAVFTSQPFDANPSQFEKPVEQVMLHWPEAQDGMPLLEEHAAPHAPQLDAVVSVLISQPLAALLSQLPQPALHAIWQIELEQEAVPLVALQPLPQAPQLPADVAKLVSQPLLASPSQLP